MLQDYELYLQLCEKRGIKSPPELLQAIKNSGATGELQLSCISILVPLCEIIGQVLISSSAIKRIDLSDCMLLSKGLSCILNALCEGSNITSLNLKGNNINGPVIALLGQVLIHNNTLKQLNLEWNSVGSHVDSFTKFCEGLTKNHNIQELDLRYNQISPYCAEALSKVLKWNKSLRIIDLAWNTIGLQGGQLLLSEIQNNKMIIKLNLHGNCIPNNILEAIEERARCNQSRQVISATNISKGIEKAKSFLSKEEPKINEISFTDSDTTIETRLRFRKKIKKRTQRMFQKNKATAVSTSENSSGKSETESNASLKDLVVVREENLVKDKPHRVSSEEDTNIMEENLSKKDVAGSDKIKELNQILQDRTTAINLLTNEIAVKTAEIEAVKSQADQLRTEIGQLKETHDKLARDNTKEVVKLREDHQAAEENWKKVHNELNEREEKSTVQKKELEMKVRRYERDIHKSTLEIANLREKIVSITQTYDDLISKDKIELHRLKRELKERENRHKNEMSILKNTLKDTTQALEDCQMQLQKSRTEIRGLIEDQILLKEKITEFEHANVRYTRSEESLHKVKEEKENLEEKLLEVQRVANNLQRQVVALQSELVEPQRRYELLNDELLQEKQKTSRLKEELSEERERTKEQNVQIQKMALQITALNTQINDIQSSHAETLRERDKERKQLKEIIATKERDINDLKAEEVQRAGQLYAAFNKYLGSRGPSTVL
ncbi:leucine-rich repeat-containing protein 45-like [Athalia rosae]|uniref:leucine-rich repeat-containing protein 45-like n=1 Tax=Athalia rosae TaxID=37344 RepID=UPI0020339BAB|nr:leucine-rich repeat-containing protein 45-like [Athalia rosae]